MKSFALLVLLCAGCTSTTVVVAPSTTSVRTIADATTTNVVTPTTWTVRRTSVLQRMDIPLLQIRADGTVTLQGYRTDGGADAAATVAAAAVSAAIKSVKP